MIPGLHAVGIHEKAAIAARLKFLADQFSQLLVVVDGFFPGEVVGARLKNRQTLGRVFRNDKLLHAQRQNDITLTAQNIFPAAVHGHGAGGAGALDIDDRHPLRKQPFPDERNKTDLSANASLAIHLSEQMHGAVAEIGKLNLIAVGHSGVVNRAEIRLPDQIPKGSVRILFEFRGIASDNINVSHFYLLQTFSAASKPSPIASRSLRTSLASPSTMARMPLPLRLSSRSLTGLEPTAITTVSAGMDILPSLPSTITASSVISTTFTCGRNSTPQSERFLISTQRADRPVLSAILSVISIKVTFLCRE